MREGVIGGEGRRENSEVVEGGVRRVRSGSTVVREGEKILMRRRRCRFEGKERESARLRRRRRRRREHGVGSDVRGEFLLGVVEFGLQLLEAVLEDGDETHAAIDGVPQTRLGLVGEGLNRVLALRRVEFVEKLGDVARPEHLVHVGKALRVVRRKIRREHALLRALPALNLAGGARRI